MIAIGRLTKPHGLRGEVVFLPYVYDIESLPDLTTQKVFVQRGADAPQEWVVIAWRRSNKRVLLQFEGVRDLAAVETLRDSEVLLPRQNFPPLPDGEYYWFDIEGLTVFTSDGCRLGTVVEIIYTGSNDVYVVRGESREFLIPALKDVVRCIDLRRRELHLFPAAELLE